MRDGGGDHVNGRPRAWSNGGDFAAQSGAAFGPEPGADGLTLRDYLGVLWRRKWVILLVVVVATGSAYFFSSRQDKVYEASADLIYEKQLDLSNPLTGQSYTDPNERSAQLTSVANIIASPDMQQRARSFLLTEGDVDSDFDISSAPVIDTSAGTSASLTSVVRITATSGQPGMAAAAANAYALAFVDYRKEIVKEQIQRAINAINSKLETYPGAAKESADYLVLQQRLRDLQLLRSTATGNFRVLVPATVPESPVAPQPTRDALLGFGVGLIAAIGLAFLLEQFDTRVRSPEDVSRILRQPILGRIPRISHKLLSEGGVVTFAHPDGQVAEAFRMIRTNLDFMAVDSEIRSILVTSCIQGEGKSVTVANLAVAMAMAGRRVVIVDADLRRPRQHQYFGIANERGLSTVATNQTSLREALVPVLVFDSQAKAGQPPTSAYLSGVDARSRLYVLPSGPIPPNPGEIVGSQRLSEIVDLLAAEADMVLVDTPAMLPVGDTSAIAPKVDGLVFLADMHVVKRPQLAMAAEQLARLPVRILGTVVRIAHGGGHYYRSSYRYGYYQSDNGKGLRHRQAVPEALLPSAQPVVARAPRPAAPSSGGSSPVSPGHDRELTSAEHRRENLAAPLGEPAGPPGAHAPSGAPASTVAPAQGDRRV